MFCIICSASEGSASEDNKSSMVASCWVLVQWTVAMFRVTSSLLGKPPSSVTGEEQAYKEGDSAHSGKDMNLSMCFVVKFLVLVRTGIWGIYTFTKYDEVICKKLKILYCKQCVFFWKHIVSNVFQCAS